MQYNVIILLLLVHVLCDFYLQSKIMAKAKRSNFEALIKHILSFLIPAGIFSIMFYSRPVLLCFFIMILSHFAIDLLKFLYEKTIYSVDKNIVEYEKTSKASYLYAIDQLIHVSVIIVLGYFFNKSGYQIRTLPVLEVNTEKLFDFFKILLMYCLVLKPVNITFEKLYAHLKPVDSGDDYNQGTKKEFKTGSMIGNLERLLVLTLLMCNQYSAIGLIFAAKSITRFSKISESQSFAEYYLLGTLFSILSTVLIYLGVNILVT